jgi:hypothetical protein
LSPSDCWAEILADEFAASFDEDSCSSNDADEEFECMEFDERYGAIACAQQPLNILIIPFAWLFFFIKDDETLKKFNSFLFMIVTLQTRLIQLVQT